MKIDLQREFKGLQFHVGQHTDEGNGNNIGKYFDLAVEASTYADLVIDAFKVGLRAGIADEASVHQFADDYTTYFLVGSEDHVLSVFAKIKSDYPIKGKCDHSVGTYHRGTNSLQLECSKCGAVIDTKEG